MRLSSLVTLTFVILIFLVLQGVIVFNRYWHPRTLQAQEAVVMGTTVDVGTPVSGVVQQVYVFENQWVAKGQPMATILPLSPVQPEGGTPHTVTAQRSGLIVSLLIKQGTFIRSDERIAQISDINFEELYVRAVFAMPPEDVSQLRTMLPAQVAADFINDGQPARAIVSTIDSRYDARSQTIGVQLRFVDFPLEIDTTFAGMPVQAWVQLEDKSALQKFMANTFSAFVPSTNASE